MYYQISRVTEDGWISIDASENTPEAIYLLAQAYQKKVDGQLWKPYEDDYQLLVKGDPFRLVFQYDDMFGNVVILNDLQDKEKVIEILQEIFKELKPQ